MSHKNKQNSSKLSTSEEAILFLSSKESAEYLKISLSQFYKLIRSGKIECYKPSGKLIYCTVSQLNEFILGSQSNTLEDEATRVYLKAKL